MVSFKNDSQVLIRRVLLTDKRHILPVQIGKLYTECKYFNNRLLSLAIHVGYKGGDIAEKYLNKI